MPEGAFDAIPEKQLYIFPGPKPGAPADDQLGGAGPVPKRFSRYQAGDVGYVPFATGHYIENTGDTPPTFLEMFRSPRYADISLRQWMALTPHALVRAHTKLDRAAIDALPKTKSPVVPG